MLPGTVKKWGHSRYHPLSKAVLNMGEQLHGRTPCNRQKRMCSIPRAWKCPLGYIVK